MSRWQSFLAGFRSCRLGVVFSAVLLALTCVGATELALRAFAFSRLPSQTFLIWTHDLWSYIPHRLGNLRDRTDRPRVFLLGSSALYHAFYGDTGLEKTLGPDGPEVVTLHTPTQGVMESLQIAENLPRGRGLVLFSTTPMRFRGLSDSYLEEAREGHLMLRAPTLAQFLDDRGRPGWRFRYALPAFVNYLRLYLPLNRRYLLEGRLPKWKSFPEKERAELAARLEKTAVPGLRNEPPRPEPISPRDLEAHLRAKGESYREPFELLALAVQIARAKGYQVALLETPMNPTYRREWGTKVAVLNELTKALALTEGIPYLDFTWRLGLNPSDFVDEVHLRYDRPGMAIYHHALAQKIRRLMQAADPFLVSRHP